MARTVRNVLLLLAAVAGIGVVAAAVAVFTMAGGCGSDTATHSRSPSGRYGVLVETSGCGATTANTTRFALTAANRLRSERALFQVTPSYAASAWRDPAAAPVRFRWEGDSTLVVAYAPAVAPSRRPSRVFDVAVRYEPLAP